LEVNHETGKLKLTDGEEILKDFPMSHIKDRLISKESYEELFDKKNN
jgi:hypothetical protein